MSPGKTLADACARLPIIPILRGLRPEDAESTGEEILAAGFSMIEIPLNSPDPYKSIAALARLASKAAIVGAGTVMERVDVDRVYDAGGTMILAPDANREVIARAVALKMIAIPGVATATEAIAALRCGATALKMFPADALGTATVRGWRAILPMETPLFAVGGIGAEDFVPFRMAGITGFGVGSTFYRPGQAAAETRAKANAFVTAWANSSNSSG